MGQKVTAADLISFSRHDQQQRKVTCIYPRLTPKSKSKLKPNSPSLPESPYCGNTVKADVVWNLRAQILRSSTDVTDLLEKYAIACCCKRWHGKRLNQTFLADLCQLWMVEVEDERKRGIVITETEFNLLDEKEAVSTTITEIKPESEACGEEDNDGHNRQLKSWANTGSKSPRVHRMITRSQAQFTALVTAKTTEFAGLVNDNFSPHAYASKTTVAQVLMRSLSERDLHPGLVYMYTRENTKGFVKIGCSRNIDKRMAAIEKKCCYKPKVECKREVWYMHRVESLIHRELYQYWRRENECWGAVQGCQVQHQEWFEVNISMAMKVMEAWVQWISKANPYDENHNLKTEWAEIATSLSKDGPLTAQMLLDEMDLMLGIQCTNCELDGNEAEPVVTTEQDDKTEESQEEGSLKSVPAESVQAHSARKAEPTEKEIFEVPEYDEDEEKIIAGLLDNISAPTTTSPSTTINTRGTKASDRLPPSTPPRQTLPLSPPLTNPTATSSASVFDTETAMRTLLTLPGAELDTFLRSLSDMRIAAGLSPPATPSATVTSDGLVFGPATTVPGVAEVQPLVGQQTQVLA